MKNGTTLTARRAGPDFLLFAEGCQVPFGRLSNCEACFVFEADDEEVVGFIAPRIEGDMSLREMLAEVRKGYEAWVEDCRAVAAAEQYAENAWLRHAERTTYEDMAFEDYEARRCF